MPPLTNTDTNPSANREALVNRSRPPYSVPIHNSVMIVAGIVHHRQSQVSSAAPTEASGMSQAGLSAPPPTTGAVTADAWNGGVEVSESFRIRPGAPPLRPGGRDGRLLE